MVSEDYKQAAALAQARNSVGETDAMACVLKDLQAALEEERFEDAARARDSGAGLLGWWAGVEVPCGDDLPPPVDLASSPLVGRRAKAAQAAPPVVLDPRGCLLRVTAAYGRVEGRPHPASAITEIHANVPPSERLAAVEMLTSMQAPVMAMHVQKGGREGYRTQAVVLCPSSGGASPFGGGPQSEDGEGGDGVEGGSSLGGTVVFDDVIRSPRGPRGGAGGGPSVRIHIVVEPRSASSPGQEGDSDAATSSAQAAELTNLLQGLTQQMNDSAADEAAGNTRGGSANSSSDEDDGPVPPPTPRRRGPRGGSSAVFVVGQDPQDKAGDGGGAMLYKGLSLDQADGISSSLASNPQRVPASLTWTGRHTFSLSYVPPPPAGSSAAARGGGTQVTAPPRRRRGRPPKAAAAPLPAEAALVVGTDTDAAATEATSGEVVAAPTAEDSQAAPQPGSLMDIVLKKWAAIAQEVARLESKPAGASPSGRAALVAAVRDASKTTLAAHGMDMSLGNGVKARVTLTLNRDGSSGSSISRRGGAGGAAQQQLVQRPRKWAFTRLDSSYASGNCVDPFTAMYVGSFGSHGPEMLQLVRGRWGDEPPNADAPGDPNDYVTAVKLTGDHNVPAGRASFKAFVGPGARLDHHGVYPEELPVLARYKGFGRAARPGFTDPQWVDGELLVLDGGAKDVTNGAELGFVWEVPGEKRFLILLGRVRLPVDVIGGL